VTLASGEDVSSEVFSFSNLLKCNKLGHLRKTFKKTENSLRTPDELGANMAEIRLENE
jgi:hypothetical protein